MPSREEKKAATRKKLLDAAAALVAKDGALATSLDAIAEKAGLTKGAVYSNFSNKRDLLYELAGVAGVAIDARDVFEDESRRVVDMMEALGRKIDASLRGASSRTWRLTYEILNYALHNAQVRRELADEWRSSRSESAEVLERVASKHGDTLPMSGVDLSLVIETLALGVAQLHAIDPKAVPDDFLPRVLRRLAS